MKFSIALIALFCVSAISAKPVKEPSLFVQTIVNLVEFFLKDFEKVIPNWDASASLEKNVITIVDKLLEEGKLPGWNPDATIKENLVNSIEASMRVFNIRDFDETKTVTENLNVFVSDFLDGMGRLPSWIPKDSIQKQIVDNVLNALKAVTVPGFDVNKSVDDDVVVWVDASLANVEGLDPSASLEDTVNAAVKNALAQVKLPGFSPSKTLEENVEEIIENLLPF